MESIFRKRYSHILVLLKSINVSPFYVVRTIFASSLNQSIIQNSYMYQLVRLTKPFLFSFLFMALCCVSGSVQGQGNNAAPTGLSSGSSGVGSVGRDAGVPASLRQVGYRPATKGSSYLNEEWKEARIELMDDVTVYERAAVRVDIARGMVEIVIDDKIKFLPSHYVKSFKFNGSSEIFLSRTAIDEPGPTGFYRLVYDNGTVPLYCHYTVRMIQAHYNPVLDAGAKDNEIVVDEAYFVSIDNDMIKLETKRKQFVKQFDGAPELSDFIKKQRLDLKDERDLITVLDFLYGSGS